MAGGWGCPHEVDDKCSKINNLPCDPGMKGCVLAGRFVFASEDKNLRLREKQAREAEIPDDLTPRDLAADRPSGSTNAPVQKKNPLDDLFK